MFRPCIRRRSNTDRAFEARSKIHKFASFATLPLFGVQLALGQSLYNGTGNTDAKKGAHAVVGAGIVGLFGVNTVTGVWNMFGAEGRRDKTGRNPPARARPADDGGGRRLCCDECLDTPQRGPACRILRHQQNHPPQPRDCIDQRRNGRLSAHALRESLTCSAICSSRGPLSTPITRRSEPASNSSTSAVSSPVAVRDHRGSSDDSGRAGRVRDPYGTTARAEPDASHRGRWARPADVQRPVVVHRRCRDVLGPHESSGSRCA